MILNPRYRTALCPYLVVGNRRVLVHLDAFCVPQSLQWPRPGSADRLGWRDPFDEWPYWEEMRPEAIRARMPSFEYADGAREYLHDATEVWADYIPDTNILEGRYLLPGGATVEITTFVTPHKDVWVRQYRVRGQGKLLLQGEFFEKCVRGHTSTHLGEIDFRGAFDAEPRGAYVILSTLPMVSAKGQVEMPTSGYTEWTMFMCMAEDLQKAADLGREALSQGFESLKTMTAEVDRSWLARAREPVARHPFIRKNYRRWLLANLLQTGRDGAMTCGARPFWSFCWPRDCAMQAAAYAAAGFAEEGRAIVEWFLDRVPDSGLYDARYFSDGAPMRLDNRPGQGDTPGFICWAASAVSRESDETWPRLIAPKLWRLADHLVVSRDEETLLPLPAADHRETKIAESMGLVGPSIGGLKGAAWIAERLGDADRAARYRKRADEIRRAAETHLWNTVKEYFMTSIKELNTRCDISTSWAIHPFEVWEGRDPRMLKTMARLVQERWNREVGGILAAPGTPHESYWMFYTSILLLGVARTGNRAMEEEILTSLERNVSPQGLVPEQISSSSGVLWGCSPLPVAHANLLLYAYRNA